MMSAIIETVQVEYRFNSDELVQLARDGARAHTDKANLEARFEVAKKQHKADVEMKDAEITRANLAVTQGYELRDIKCVVLKFRPDENHLMVVRTDNGRVTKHRKMRDDEKQISLLETQDPTVFMCEFYADGSGDVLEMVGDVPLRKSEWDQLKHIEGLKFRPMAKQIDDGKDAKDGKGKGGRK